MLCVRVRIGCHRISSVERRAHFSLLPFFFVHDCLKKSGFGVVGGLKRERKREYMKNNYMYVNIVKTKKNKKMCG